MSNYCFALNLTFETIACADCGITFAVDSQTRAGWLRDGPLFYCPRGHVQQYRETEAQKLKKQLDAQQVELDRTRRDAQFAKNNALAERAAREQTERRLSARKGINTRLRNRIKHGVCPCCHRTVQQLARHMKTKHPQFNPDDGE